MEVQLVSIIIPTYNRAHLIVETLDSILEQTYTNWECLVIDDRSTDNTDSVLQKFGEKDARIKYFKRPSHFSKGGNVCRNIGLDKASGDYIVFFDSDDLMTLDHLEVKIEGIEFNQVDFCITKTEYFNKPKELKNHRYLFDQFDITLDHYLAQRINWLTLDVCIKAHCVQNIRFNETLQSGQEYNFYAKLLEATTNAVYIPKVVSLRRYHEASIQHNLKSTGQKRVSSFLSKWYTYQDLKKKLTTQEQKTILYRCIRLTYALKKVPKPYLIPLLFAVFKIFRIHGFYFLGLIILLPFGKGYSFHSKLRKLSLPISILKEEANLKPS